jgi:sugar phosphate isomerase/epimerase
MLTRRQALLAPAAFAVMHGKGATELNALGAASGKMTLALHQNSSARAGYRGSLEGWARAGIRLVEITSNMLDEFLKTDSLAAASRVLTDLGLTPVSGSCGVLGLLLPNPARPRLLDTFKKRCEMFATLGIPRTYSTTAAPGNAASASASSSTTPASASPTAAGASKPTLDDYKIAADNLREVGEAAKEFKLTMMFEFVRQSSFASTLPTMLSITRAAAHPNVGILFDCYHFWSGLNKLEDLDSLGPGEIAHVHFQDVPDMPRELLDNATRVIPGDGVTPLAAILRKLSEKGYAGALSVELFASKFQQADPFELAREIKPKAEAVMRRAGVL